MPRVFPLATSGDLAIRGRCPYGLPMSNLARARAYLRAIETGDEALMSFFTTDAIQREFPNRLVPQGATRDLAQLAAANERGRTVVSKQRYDVVTAVEEGDRVALELIWTGRLSVAVGTLAAGDEMRARFAVFFTFEGGLIKTQHNYDCFDPF